MKKVTNHHLALALHNLTRDATKEQLPKQLSEFVMYLAKEGLLSKAEAIMREYENVWDKEHDITTITVESRHPLTSHQQSAIAEMFMKEVHCKNVEVKNVIQEKLLGGYKIIHHDTIYDYSLSGKLSQLSQHLVKNF